MSGRHLRFRRVGGLAAGLLLAGAGCGSPLPPNGSPAPGAGFEPIRIIRGDPTRQFVDLSIVGMGLASVEGRLVTVRIGIPDRAPERLASGQARVTEGGF